MDFTDKVLAVFKVGSLRFVITQSILAMWIVMGVLILFGVIVKIRSKRFTDKPTGFQNVVEFIVETLENFTTGIMGAKNRKFTNYYGSLFLFLLFANISGVFGLRPPTANYAVPLGLALITFFMTLVFGIKANGIGGYLKSLTEPVWPLTPLNIIGELSNPVSLSFRLFGNIIGGTILMGLYYGLLPIYVKIGIPALFHAYLDIFAGVLQAFVFTMLSMIFVSSAMGD